MSRSSRDVPESQTLRTLRNWNVSAKAKPTNQVATKSAHTTGSIESMQGYEPAGIHARKKARHKRFLKSLCIWRDGRRMVEFERNS